jgi:hypothetical protein
MRLTLAIGLSILLGAGLSCRQPPKPADEAAQTSDSPQAKIPAAEDLMGKSLDEIKAMLGEPPLTAACSLPTYTDEKEATRIYSQSTAFWYYYPEVVIEFNASQYKVYRVHPPSPSERERIDAAIAKKAKTP